MSHRTIGGVLLGIGIGFAALAAVYLIPRVGRHATPDTVAREFFLDTYMHDYASAWELVSSADQDARGRDEYLSGNPAASEAQRALYGQLAEWGMFEVLAIVSTEPARSLVSARIRFPRVHQDEVAELLDQAANEGSDQSNLLDRLLQLKLADRLQFVEGDISYDLVSEDNRWRVAQHWGQSVTVHFESALSPDLPWDFYPVLSEQLALPGELVRASYFARNNSAETITAKAIHQVGPPEAAPFLQTIQCFCFTEQTLEPGEEREMVLIFRIDFSAPRELTDLENLYTFYSLDAFPTES